jgi:hypothetical protein
MIPFKTFQNTNKEFYIIFQTKTKKTFASVSKKKLISETMLALPDHPTLIS